MIKQTLKNNPRLVWMSAAIALLLTVIAAQAAGFFEDKTVDAHWRTLNQVIDDRGQPYLIVQFALDERCAIRKAELQELNDSGDDPRRLFRVSGEAPRLHRCTLGSLLGRMGLGSDGIPKVKIRPGKSYRLILHAERGRHATLDFTT